MTRFSAVIGAGSLMLTILCGCSSLPPATRELAATRSVQPTLEEAASQTPSIEDSGELTVRDAPTIPEVSARMREVYQRGIDMGRNPALFTKVGDCMTASPAFLFPYGMGQYDFGTYGSLQEVVEHFSTDILGEVNGQQVDSFSNPSQTVSCGFNSAGPLDPTWANPNYCQNGESPLECELRVSNALFALIMLGTHDMHFSQDIFRGYLDAIVQTMQDKGVVPILITFPPRTDELAGAELYNGVVLEVARSRDIPAGNLWLALQDKPNYGVQADHPTALSVPPDGCTTCFTADNLQYGATVQNLVALQALDAVWKAVSQ